jgi:hypothetical protein
MKHHLVTLLWLVAALTCYAAGMQATGTGLFAVGFVFEIIFWTRLLRRTGRERQAARDQGLI